MTIHTADIVQAARETSPVPQGSCKTCERTGMPILPLRWAVVPRIDGLQALDRLSNPNTQLSMRMLRAGYLYVLLDRSVWQAYQVSPEGCLRQFNPYDAPHGDPATLPEQCTTQSHDVRSSFIHIDTKRYSQAQVAFSNDAWSISVLDAYKKGADADGKPLAAGYTDRFVTYTLSALKSEPTRADHALPLQHGFEMENTIAEFAYSYADFGSVHGFHSRVGRLEAMQMYLRQAEKLHGLDKGVAGLMLPDPIGLLQELNGLVRAVQTQRQLWAQDEAGTEVVTSEGRQIVKHLRPYQYLTSQCLLGINALYARQADAETPDSPTPVLDHMQSESGSPPVFGDPARERAEVLKHKTDESVARLQERYDERARKAFQDAYDKQMSTFQRAIDAHGKDWAAQIADPAWKRVVRHDYAGTDKYSAGACIKTVAVCLAGGPSEAVPMPQPPGEPKKSEALGPTSAAWKALLEDAESPIYAALLAQNAALRSAFAPILGAGAMPNEAGKKYFDAIKGLIGSHEVSTLRERAVREAADALLAAVHNAASRLEGRLSEGVKAAVSHIHSGSALLFADLHLTQVKVQLTVGEYYNLLSKQLNDRADRSPNALGKHARAMVFSGLISIPSPAVRNTLIDITLWVQGAADEVHAKLASLRGAGEAGHANAIRRLTAGAKNLEFQAATALHGIQLTAADARKFAGKSFAGLRSMAGGGADGSLAMIALYFQADALKANLAALDMAVGAEHPEAVAAMYGASVGVMGASIEVVGLGLKVPAEAARAFVQRGGVAEVPQLARMIGAGNVLVKSASAIGALTGIFEGVGTALAAGRGRRGGDDLAMTVHVVATVVSFLGAGFSLAAVRSAALLGGVLGLGPLGWALILGVSAYSIARFATSLESSPLERWARRCFFGDHAEKPPVAWLTPADAEVAISELNAVLLGMNAELGFHEEARLKDDVAVAQTSVEDLKNGGAWERGKVLKYRVLLPAFDPDLSSYEFRLVAERYGLQKESDVLRDRTQEIPAQTLASGALNYGAGAAAVSPSPHRIPDYVPTGSILPTRDAPIIGGSYSLESLHSIKSVTLIVTYWPDKSDVNGFASLSLKEMAP